MKRWIWEQDNYPNFTYDINKLENLIEKISLEQGYLIAMNDVLPKDTITQRQLEALESEAISTSAIEGEILNRNSVKESIKRKLGFKNIDYSRIDESTDYLIEVLIDANTNYEKNLTIERLFAWHNALFPKGFSGISAINVADLRGEETMEIVSSHAGSEKVFYVAPPRSVLEDQLNDFITWFNKTDTSLLKACISHLWFVIIHPFDDGNGRITRAITDLVLSKIEKSKISKLYSMSSIINKNRNNYYKALEQTTGYIKKQDNHLDITIWCEFFLQTLYDSLLDTKKKLRFITDKTKFWDKYKDNNLNARQTKVLNKILDIGIEDFIGGLSKKKYLKIADTTSTTGSRDINELIKLGCIQQIEGTVGRNTKYEINIPIN